MSLRSEAIEAAAKACEASGCPSTARHIRKERPAGLAERVSQAVLAVIDKYEEVEVQLGANNLYCLRTRGSPFWNPSRPSFTIYRKKQEPAPDVEELARRAVKEWEQRRRDLDNHGCVYAKLMDDAMDALAEALDK